jgi:hypothetical protein
MAAATTPLQYIQPPQLLQQTARRGRLLVINVDSITVSILLGLVGMGFIWWVVRGDAGVPTRRQALVER